MNEVNVRKLPTYIIAIYTCNFISKLPQGGKSVVAFCLTVQKFHRSFCVGSLDCESRFQNGICIGPFQKKSKQNRKKGKNGKRTLEFLDLPLYPWKCQTQWSLTPGNSIKLCYIHLNFRSKTKNQDPWKFHIIFSGSPFEIPLLFYGPVEFPHSVYLITLDLPCPQPSPVWMFPEIDHWKLEEKK